MWQRFKQSLGPKSIQATRAPKGRGGPVLTLSHPLPNSQNWPAHPSVCAESGRAFFQCKPTRRRGSVALKVTPERITFLVPNVLSKKQMATTFENHQAWLFSSLHQQLQRLQQQRQQSPFHLQCDHPFALLGEEWTWQLTPCDKIQVHPKASIDWTQRHWKVRATPADVATIQQALGTDPTRLPERLQTVFRKLCQARLTQWLSETLPDRAAQIGVQPTDWQVKHYRARWGSCDHKGRVRFHWAIALMPESVADYVLVHELCHLIHFDHSRHFWQQVAQHSPNFQEAERFLKREGAGLMWV
ncbi:M48 family metallopeptidase [Hydrogenovibrio halophilus]|uniref:M48 family metallopeptidase n=1 Tax=Hydrogenovibrio halophilus TaxID=373391 RepID=UPI0003703AC0|nr:M48 family metallopeptidase [Hydrogenovibrio halophilus]